MVVRLCDGVLVTSPRVLEGGEGSDDAVQTAVVTVVAVQRVVGSARV